MLLQPGRAGTAHLYDSKQRRQPKQRIAGSAYGENVGAQKHLKDQGLGPHLAMREMKDARVEIGGHVVGSEGMSGSNPMELVGTNQTSTTKQIIG